MATRRTPTPAEPPRLSDFTPDPNNANLGTERGRAVHEQSVRRKGFGRPMLADRHGVLIAGNKTAEVVAELFGPDVEVDVVRGDGTRPVIYVREDLDLEADPRAAELALADNRVAEVNLRWNPAVLRGLVERGVDAKQYWSEKELGRMLPPAPTSLALLQTGDAEPDELHLPARVAAGEVWALGEHRLWCGDATDQRGIATILGGQQPVAVFVDPEYNAHPDFQAQLLLAAMSTAAHNVVLWTGVMGIGEVPKRIRVSKYRWSHVLVWFRGERTKAAFRGVPESTPAVWLTFICVWRKQREGERAVFDIPRAAPFFAELGIDIETGVPQLLDVNRRSDGGHAEGGTEHGKPIKLWAALQALYGASGPILDLCSGTGTAFLAAEAVGQRVYGIELAPRRCDVAVARWEEATGGTAQRLGAALPVLTEGAAVAQPAPA